jgi:hypothetical protein
VNLYDSMMQACLSGLNEGERHQISVGLLCRIVGLCAEVVEPDDPDEAPPALQYIKASMVRLHDTVWRPETERFAAVVTTDADLSVGLIRVEFDDGATFWYSTADTVQIPLYETRARDWNQRHPAAAGATPTEDR